MVWVSTLEYVDSGTPYPPILLPTKTIGMQTHGCAADEITGKPGRRQVQRIRAVWGQRD